MRGLSKSNPIVSGGASTLKMEFVEIRMCTYHHWLWNTQPKNAHINKVIKIQILCISLATCQQLLSLVDFTQSVFDSGEHLH